MVKPSHNSRSGTLAWFKPELRNSGTPAALRPHSDQQPFGVDEFQTVNETVAHSHRIRSRPRMLEPGERMESADQPKTART